MNDAPVKSATNRDELGRFGAGNNANPNGRPKGQTLKEFARQYLMSLSDEDKLEYLGKLPPEIVWRMSEGNPTEDRNVKISVPQPILGGSSQAIGGEVLDAIDAPQNEGVDKP